MNIHHKNPNYEHVASALRKTAETLPEIDSISEVLSTALNAADPELAVKKHLKSAGNVVTVGGHLYSLLPHSRVITIALGKAAPAMLRGAAEQLGSLFQGGVCVCKHLDSSLFEIPQTKMLAGDHPVPGEGSLLAGLEIQRAVEGLNKEDLVILLLSGGGSSLAALPQADISLADMQHLTNLLLRSGANITELNTVRKHLDGIKGGGLARLAFPASVAALVLSDVIGNHLGVIASGPAYPDETTFDDALAILKRVETIGLIPESILRHLQNGARGNVPETLKADDLIANNVFNKIVASNEDSCAAAVEKAKEFGFYTEVISSKLIGEARVAARQIVSELNMRRHLQPPFLLVWGGETTVTVTGNGKGGRNQELALSAAIEMEGMENTSLITLATDGEDGPTDAAGAIVSGNTFTRACKNGLNPKEFFNNNDAYSFFNQLDGLIRIGPTGTNVNDLTFVFRI